LMTTLFDRYKIHTVGIDYENIHCIRVTPHVYTTIADLDKFVGAMGEIAASKKA
jgi:selenocysteine lyase/cysteine desulfurase